MEDVLDLYTLPLDPEFPQVCMDEKTKQLVKEIQLPLAAKPGRVERYDYEYERNGVGHLFMYYEPLVGVRHVEVKENHTKTTWAEVTKQLLDSRYKEAKKVRLVVDNLSTHGPEAFYQAFAPEEARRLVNKIEWHYTPRHASWLNMAEIALAKLEKECLDRRIPDLITLKDEIAAWEQQANDVHRKTDWRFTTAEARIKLKRLYPAL